MPRSAGESACSRMSLGGTCPDYPVGRGGRGLYLVEVSNVRTNVVRLWVNKKQHRLLKRLADACARLWNELNYERRRQFFNEGRVDFKKTYEKYYEKYKHVLKVNAGTVIQLNNEAWRSFFELLRLKKQNRLPPFITKVSPPGYWKCREFGKRELILVVRCDRYYIDTREKILVLKDWGLKISFSGRLRWSGKQGRLIIKFVNGVWYAYIPVEVGKPAPKSNPKGYIRGELGSVKIFEPRGSEKAAIDLGINNLFAVVVSNGERLLYRGRTIKSEFFYLLREIALVQHVRDWLRNRLPNSPWIRYYTKEIIRLYELLRRRRIHLVRTAVKHLAKMLWELGVSEVIVGYPKNISQTNGNIYSTNIWSYRFIIQELARALWLYGIRTYVLESECYTSITCSRCGKVDPGNRKYRGLFVCKYCGLIMNADINAALNIMKLVYGKIPEKLNKTKTFIVTHNGVKPITPNQRGNPNRPLG